MNETLAVPVSVRWFAPEEGGRRTGPPPGPVYTPTGRFESEDLAAEFSVVLDITGRVAADDPYRVTGVLRPGFPENIPDFADRLRRGERFILHEGRRAVAECVLSVPAPATTGF